MPGAEEAKTSRRDFLKNVASAAAGVAVGAGVGLYAQTPASGSREAVPRTATLTETEVQTVTETLLYPASLRIAAENRGLLVGSVADDADLKDKRFGTTLPREFNSVTALVTWGPTDQYAHRATDSVAKLAFENQMKLKGHPLVSHRGLPEWANPQISAGELRRRMQNHIRGEVAHYRGKVYAWYVVNEAVDREGLRNSIFLEKLGEGYIAEAFRLAHETDPNALLFYNDYDAEAAGGLQKGKSDRVYELVKKLVSDSVPIHGVGLQMHLFAVEYPKPEDIAANVRRLASLGLKVAISEMDVSIKDLPLDMSERLAVQRHIYHDVIAACVREKGFTDLTFWGFSDAQSVTGETGDGPDYPLLFDQNYQPKPAYWGVMDALLGR